MRQRNCIITSEMANEIISKIEMIFPREFRTVSMEGEMRKLFFFIRENSYDDVVSSKKYACDIAENGIKNELYVNAEDMRKNQKSRRISSQIVEINKALRLALDQEADTITLFDIAAPEVVKMLEDAGYTVDFDKKKEIDVTVISWREDT